MKRDQYNLVFGWYNCNNEPVSHPELNIIAANEFLAALQRGGTFGFLRAELTINDNLEAFTGFWKLEGIK